MSGTPEWKSALHRLHLAGRAATRWSETDRGPWEVRSEPRHVLYSKLLSWVALDRALRIPERRGEGGDHISEWRLERERVREVILTEGYNEELGAFTYAFDCPVLDASLIS